MNVPISLVNEILHDPAASKWLKEALRSALDRDPVDVLNDSLKLAALYQAVVAVLFEENEYH